MSIGGIFKHDCTKCSYMFSMIEENKLPYDIYVCGENEKKSLILRFGNEPEENKSVNYDWFLKTNLPEYVKIREAINIRLQFAF